jgi:DNA topoisomerase-3
MHRSAGVVTEEAKPTTQGAPLLYDLTTLQREATAASGFPHARRCRSRSRSTAQGAHLSADGLACVARNYIATVNATMQALTETNAYAAFARQVLKQKWVKPNKRISDNAKVSDHFAIIPTLVQPKHLNELEAKLYDFVVRHFLAVFYPPAGSGHRITRVVDEPSSPKAGAGRARLARRLRQGSADR